MISKGLSIAFGLLLLLSIYIFAYNKLALAAVPSGFTDTLFAAGFGDRLIAMQFSPDGRLFVSEKGGKVRIVKNGTLLPTPYVTIAVNTSEERGLYGVEFDPNYVTNRFVYIYYTNTSQKNRISRFTTDPTNPDIALPNSELILIDNIDSGIYHQGGALHFGPDGKLYIGVGDATVSSNGQNLNTLPGKILRINSDGTIPSDNPFVGQAGKRGEIWAYGLRNPYTFAFQPGTGLMYINDVGNSTWEELNVGQKGANYGWPTCEGVCSTPNMVNPIYAYSHNGASAAITGAAFNTGNNFPAQYANDYFFGDYSQDFIKSFDIQTQQATSFGTQTMYPADLRFGPDGLLYYMSVELKQIHRISYGAAPTPTPLPGSGQVTLTETDDDHVSAGAPTTNYAFSPKMYVVSPSGAINNIFLKFNLSSLAGKVITNASFKFKTTTDSGSGSSATQNFKLVNDNSWTESSLNYNNQPAMTTTLATLATTPSNTLVTVPLTPSVIQPKVGGLFSMGISATGANDVMFFYSKDNATDKPQLVINYTDPTPTPTPTPVGQPPVPVINLPTIGTTFRAGDDINYSGSATDPDEGLLSASHLTWEVLFHHQTHTHPYMDPVTGTSSGTLHIADTGEESPDIWYRFHLKATDSTGRTSEVTRDITPLKSNFTLDTIPTGLTVYVDGHPKTTPTTIQGVVNFNREISTDAVQNQGGNTYGFDSWSDGGAIDHIISTPETDTTYIATFTQSDPTITPTITPTQTPTPTLTPTETPTPTLSPTPTNSPTPTESPTPTVTSSPTPSPTPIPNHNITGTVYVDTNGNGAQDINENGYNNATINITGGRSASTTTDPSGVYNFTDNPEAGYSVALTVPSGYHATTTNPVITNLNTDLTINFGIAVNPTPTLTPTNTPTPTFTPTPTLTPTFTPTPTPMPNLLQNPGFETTGSNWLNPWQFKVRTPAVGTITRDTTTQHTGAASARVNVTTASTDWYVQVLGGNFQMTAGVPYTVKYWAKASSNRNIRIGIQGVNTPYTLHFQQTRAITTNWAEYSVTFTPTASNTNTSINFNLGTNTGQIWLDDVSITRN